MNQSLKLNVTENVTLKKYDIQMNLLEVINIEDGKIVERITDKEKLLKWR